ncbi:hypothetical protein IMZ48_04355 [Candidatus Bathyarchaeota archaeon]|nr:hypothetical protein [Candidatus Bathyarchaeota archaeon]
MPQDSSHPLQSRFQRYQQQKHGRHQNRLACVLCGTQLSLGLDAYNDHFRAEHAHVLESELAAGGDAAAIGRKYYRRSQDPQIAGYVLCSCSHHPRSRAIEAFSAGLPRMLSPRFRSVQLGGSSGVPRAVRSAAPPVAPRDEAHAGLAARCPHARACT